MIELKELRNYKQEGFINDQGKVQMKLYLGDEFYYNKLKVGDGVEGFRRIDNILQWSEGRRGWYFLFHNYQPFLPEYADDWFLYRDVYKSKDQIFAFKPRNVQHVQGRLVANIPGVTDINAVIYDDAFGPGMDLIIKFTFKKMMKIVRIRDGFKPAVDTDFDFILKFPEGVGVYTRDLDNGSIIAMDPLTPKTIKPRSEMFIGSDINDPDSFTRIAPFRVWDSGQPGQGKGQKIELTPSAIVVLDNATILRKRVTATFLAGSTGDVFTDATATYTENKDTYYGTSFVTGGDPNGGFLRVGGWGDFYYSYIEWDLTGSPGARSVSDAKLSLKVQNVATNNNTGTVRRVTTSWTEAGVTSSNVPGEDTTTIATLTNPVTIGVGNRDEQSILTLYKWWKDGTFSNYGLKLHSTSNTDAQHNYYSSDDGTSDNHPWIIVTLTDLAYTRGQATSLPSNGLDEEIEYTAGNKTDVATNDATRVSIAGRDVLIHLFKYRHTNNTDQITVTWDGQASTAPSSKQVKLQIYNFNTPGWEDLDSDNATAANTDFELTGSKTTSLSNYYDGNNYIYARVYQSLL